MSKRLVIVESPTKAKTIGKFLGKDFEVTSSYGHVRDLPNNAKEIPEDVKKEKWSRLGINVDSEFEPLYVIPDSKKKRVSDLRKLLKDADELLLATDEDREGESISWHLLEVLDPKKIPVKRLVFHEITKEAIQHALDSAREVNMDLVKAQETRRIIDRLFGYSVSPLLWKKMRPRLSAGRVQSVATRLLVEKERLRISFVSAEYWDLKAVFTKLEGKGQFEGELIMLDGARIAVGKDFDPDTGKLAKPGEVVLLNGTQAEALKAKIKDGQGSVVSHESKPFTTKPYPPFTTSTLQQEASRKLSFSARRTMQVAQTLYENGFITYMRTDSTTLSDEAISGARRFIQSDFGKEFLPDQPRTYKTKVKNAQEAHEAIRPSGSDFTSIKDVRAKLGVEATKLYELIWKRTIACQMKDAEGIRVSVHVAVENATFRASGKTITFPGHLRAYVEGSDDPEAELADQEKVLPPLTEGERLGIASLDTLSHTTKPPARYTEGSLIKELERLGIGRPSTWATIVDVVLQRDYAFKKGTALVPTFLAVALTGLMERYFTNLVDYSFTASLEDDLDAIARGEADNLKYLKGFYFGNGLPGLKGLVESGEENIDPRDVCGVPIGEINGTEIEVRIGRYGPFITNGEVRAGTPDMLPPDELSVESAAQILAEAEKGPQSLGQDPETGKNVYVKVGRFGPYVQLGENDEEEKPKMASLLQGMKPADIDLELALKLLSLPRSLGEHPELKDEVIAANGRYGPYIKCGSETRSLSPDEYSPITVTFEQALEVLKQPKRRGRGAPKAPLKELGKHPVTELELVVKSGRFGPYITDGKVNASVPKGYDIESLTMEDAVNLMNARVAKLAEQEASGEIPEKKTTKSKAKPKAKSKEKAKAKSKTKTKSKAKTKSKSKTKSKAKKKE